MHVVKGGESHGKAMVGILCNVPAGITVDKNKINAQLKERNFALGRSERQKIERDKIDLITGVRNGVTIGNNVAIVIKNNVWKDYEEVMHPFSANVDSMQLTALRPGHADLGGVCRTQFLDARNILEGASARSTCIDTALGAIAISMLEELGIKIGVSVKTLGSLEDEKICSFEKILTNKAPAFSQNKKFIKECEDQIKLAILNGESLGGSVEICVSPIKPGFGFYVGEKRVDALIAQLIMQLQAVKGVYFGQNPFAKGVDSCSYLGEIISTKEDGLVTLSSSGGIDGGMTNGDFIKITVGIKPIPTTKKGNPTFDLKTGQPCVSAKERSDVTAVFAICPVLKSVVALALSEVICERLGSDNMQAIKQRYLAL